MLPGLAPPHTQKSLHSATSPESSGSRLIVEKIISSPDDFLISESGLWLLPPKVAEKDVEQDIARAEWLAQNLENQETAKTWSEKFKRISALLTRSWVSVEGCVQGGLRGRQTPAQTVIRLAEFEMGAGTHTTADEVPFVSMCGNNDCYNARHHRLDFGGTRRDLQRVELNPSWYKNMSDHSIETIWGDTLPSVQTSLRYFIEFQRLNFPFVPIEKSPLTPGPMSQIGFHPLTGCWESYIYEKNTAGLMNIKNGYGIMYARQGPDLVDPHTGIVKKGYRRGSVLAHNLIWDKSGRQLTAEMERNHLCNYTRCCNPLHIEQVSPEENRRHGHHARARIRDQERKDPSTKYEMLTKEQQAALYVEIRKQYDDMSKEYDSKIL